MATPGTFTQQQLDLHLDAMDRALLGLLPRCERLAVIADLESRIREAAENSPEIAEVLSSPAENLPLADTVAGGNRRAARRRSSLALTAGIVGIVALVLLFILPLTYLVIAMMGEEMGELVAYTLLIANIMVVAVGGAAAVALGIAALIRLSRGHQRGHGWAITGLCTGPLPMLAGGLGMLTIVVPLLGEMASTSSGNQTVAVCAPAPMMLPPSGYQPAQVAAAPSYGAPQPQPVLPGPPPPATEIPTLQPAVQPANETPPAASLQPAPPPTDVPPQLPPAAPSN